MRHGHGKPGQSQTNSLSAKVTAAATERNYRVSVVSDSQSFVLKRQKKTLSTL